MIFDTALMFLVLVLMVMLLVVSIIPNMPGPALLWLVGTIYAISEQFERVTIWAVVVMTVFMAIGSTSDLWMRLLGMRNRGSSCWAVLGSVFGGLLGTFLIPIPILGTLIGAVAGALIIELLHAREIQTAVVAGRSVIESYVLGVALELLMGTAIILTFLASVWLTSN